MVHRSIIQLSPTTKVISLPSDWLKKNKIQKGDSVNVEEKYNQIIIETTKKTKTSISSDIRELSEDLLWTAIDAFYIMGYDDVELRLTKEQMRIMIKAVKYFPMFVIDEESNERMRLKAVANSLDVDFDRTIQRIRHLTSMMIDSGINHIKNQEWSSLKDIKKIDYTLNTYVSMCFRHLSTKNMPASFAWAQYVKILEQFADRLCMMFADISKTRKADIKKIMQVHRLYQDSFKLLSNFSIRQANEQQKQNKELSMDKSIHIQELARSLFDLQEIIFQLKEADSA
jgi:phosphate uptake regulator